MKLPDRYEIDIQVMPVYDVNGEQTETYMCVTCGAQFIVDERASFKTGSTYHLPTTAMVRHHEWHEKKGE